MLDTKLILIDGITGSGKSTTAHYLARQLEKNGYKVKWFYEHDVDHPLKEIEQHKEDDNLTHSERVLREYPLKWATFVNQVKDDDYIYIVESYWFQDVLLSPHFENDLDRQIIRAYSHRISEIVSCLNPVLIHFYQHDIDKSLRLTWERRPNVKGLYLEGSDKTLYCKNRGLTEEEGCIKLWQDFSAFSVELFNDYDFNKLQIENSAQDWSTYRTQILDFLGLEQFEEKYFDAEYTKYCGKYFYCGDLINIYTKDNRLCFDGFWPNLKLIEVANDTFEIDGAKGTIYFLKDNDGFFRTFKFIVGLPHYDEKALYKLICQPQPQDIARLCGDYWCEADKLRRRIYHEEGKFYYWREEGNFNELGLEDPTNMYMVGFGSFYLEFDFSTDQHKFILKNGKNEPLEFVKIARATLPVHRTMVSTSNLPELLKEQYGFQEITTCQFFRHGLNDTYLVKADKTTYYLRIYRYKWRTQNDVLSEIKILNHLQAEGVSVAAPVAKVDGTFHTELRCPEGKRQAVLFYEAKGKFKARDEENSLVYGRLVATIHQQGDQLSQLERFHIDLEHLLDEPLKNIKPFLAHRKEDYNYLVELSGKLKRRINELVTKESAHYGFCHGDHHGGNLHFDENNQPTIFDFDCGGYGWRAYDLAVYLWAGKIWCNWEKEEVEKIDKIFETFLSGYQEVSTFSENERLAVPVFVVIRHIWLMGLHTRDANMACTYYLQDDYFDGYIGHIKKWLEHYPIFTETN